MLTLEEHKEIAATLHTVRDSVSEVYDTLCGGYGWRTRQTNMAINMFEPLDRLRGLLECALRDEHRGDFDVRIYFPERAQDGQTNT
ncbi:hypothetical protein LCGC14_0561390 [marine sediment metagenome]|uniref:Uncharacterized protein n=1 Tax=marine sediment metagenome TaxID=412755 RepID=A0A0F9S5K1_9ZZZZ